MSRFESSPMYSMFALDTNTSETGMTRTVQEGRRNSGQSRFELQVVISSPVANAMGRGTHGKSEQSTALDRTQD